MPAGGMGNGNSWLHTPTILPVVNFYSAAEEELQD